MSNFGSMKFMYPGLRSFGAVLHFGKNLGKREWNIGAGRVGDRDRWYVWVEDDDDEDEEVSLWVGYQYFCRN